MTLQNFRFPLKSTQSQRRSWEVAAELLGKSTQVLGSLALPATHKTCLQLQGAKTMNCTLLRKNPPRVSSRRQIAFLIVKNVVKFSMTKCKPISLGKTDRKLAAKNSPHLSLKKTLFFCITKRIWDCFHVTHCELKRWKFGGSSCLIHGLHLTV